MFPKLISGEQVPVWLQNRELLVFLVLDDRFVDVAVIEHLAERLGNLYLFDIVLLGDPFYDLFGGSVDPEFSVDGQIIEIFRDQLVIGFVDLGIGRDLVMPGGGKLELCRNRARDTVNTDGFVTLIDDKTNDR